MHPLLIRLVLVFVTVDMPRRAFLRVLHSFPQLVDLRYLGVRPNDTIEEEASDTPELTLPWKLRTLEVTSVRQPGFLANMLALGPLPVISTLIVPLVSAADVTTTGQFLGDIRGPLTRFQFEIGTCLLSLTDMQFWSQTLASISSCSALADFHIVLPPLAMDSDEQQDEWRMLLPILSSLPSKSIRDIAVTFKAPPSSDPLEVTSLIDEEILLHAHSLQLEAVDALLASIPDLRSVKFVLGDPPHGSGSEGSVQLLSNDLLALRGRDIVSFEF